MSKLVCELDFEYLFHVSMYYSDTTLCIKIFMICLFDFKIALILHLNLCITDSYVLICL